MNYVNTYKNQLENPEILPCCGGTFERCHPLPNHFWLIDKEERDGMDFLIEELCLPIKKLAYSEYCTGTVQITFSHNGFERSEKGYEHYARFTIDKLSFKVTNKFRFHVSYEGKDYMGSMIKRFYANNELPFIKD